MKLYFTEIIIHYHQFTVVVVTTVIEYIFVYSLSTRTYFIKIFKMFDRESVKNYLWSHIEESLMAPLCSSW